MLSRSRLRHYTLKSIMAQPLFLNNLSSRSRNPALPDTKLRGSTGSLRNTSYKQRLRH